MCAISEAVNDELVAEGRHKFVIVRLSGSCARIGTHKSACDSPTSGLCVMRDLATSADGRRPQLGWNPNPLSPQ